MEPEEQFEMIDPSLDVETNELFLDFLSHDDEVSPEYVKRRVTAALDEFGFEEILSENGMENDEALGILFELGYIGLPEFIEYENENVEVQDIQEEEE